MVNLVISVVAFGLLLPTVVFLRRVLKQQTSVLEKLDVLKKVVDEDYAEPAPLEHEEAVPPIEGPPVGAPAPSFTLTAISGEQVTLDDLLALGKSVLLLFVSPNCSPCKTLLLLVRVWERDYSTHLTIALLSKGTLEENQKHVVKYGASHLLLQGESAIAEEYQAKWTPAAVLISHEGKITSQMSYGDEAIRALVTHTVTTVEVTTVDSNGNGHRPHIAVGNSLFKVGEPAPRFSLPRLNGAMVNIEELLGRDTLLLFWDPGCPHCQAMTEDLKRWEEKSRQAVPRLVIVASGDAAAIKVKGQEFSSLVLADPEFDLGPLFGTNSTPSAVLIDGEGRIASSLAKGEKNILALAGVRKVSLPIAARN